MPRPAFIVWKSYFGFARLSAPPHAFACCDAGVGKSLLLSPKRKQRKTRKSLPLLCERAIKKIFSHEFKAMSKFLYETGLMKVSKNFDVHFMQNLFSIRNLLFGWDPFFFSVILTAEKYRLCSPVGVIWNQFHSVIIFDCFGDIGNR